MLPPLLPLPLLLPLLLLLLLQLLRHLLLLELRLLQKLRSRGHGIQWQLRGEDVFLRSARNCVV